MTARRKPGSERGCTLTLSIGNTSIFGGIFAGKRLIRAFRFAAADLIRLPKRVREPIRQVAVCSVVPAVTPDVLRLVRRAWGVESCVLTAESSHGLSIGYRRPRELGADRVAAACGARATFAGKNVIIVDCGTATTVTALRRDGRLLGGAIFPGSALWPDMLALRTAQLPRIAVTKPHAALGKSPREGIASGVYFGHLGAIREVVARVRVEAFGRGACSIVGTGGNAPRFDRGKVFDCIEPNLALIGLRNFAAANGD